MSDSLSAIPKHAVDFDCKHRCEIAMRIVRNVESTRHLLSQASRLLAQALAPQQSSADNRHSYREQTPGRIVPQHHPVYPSPGDQCRSGRSASGEPQHYLVHSSGEQGRSGRSGIPQHPMYQSSGEQGRAMSLHYRLLIPPFHPCCGGCTRLLCGSNLTGMR